MNTEKLTKDRIYILAAHELVQRSADMAYPFHQEPNFRWLTGLNEPDWLCIADTHTNTLTLLAPKHDEVRSLFDGQLEAAKGLEISKAQAVISFEERDAYLKELAERHDTVWILGAHPYADSFASGENPSQHTLRDLAADLFRDVQDSRKEFNRLRAIKSTEEIEHIRGAIRASVEGFVLVRATLETMRAEYEAEAELSRAFRRSGADGHAYDPIVAGGKNACTLHYSHNSADLVPGELLLIDAGASLQGYAADITRTYSFGVSTPRQQEVHAAVEAAHYKIIALIQPGVSLKDYSDQSDEIMKEALRALDLLKEDGDYRRYFPHAISHGLGLDVHESLGGFETFQPGMVLTVEPGVYIPEEGIGVRIEDDILVTMDGNENLSAALPTSL